MKKVFALFGVAVVLSFGSVIAAAQAFATASVCQPVSYHLTDRPDGTSANNGFVWATDQIDRTLTICTEPPADDVSQWSYTATITDTGTFKTTGLGSPKTGAVISANLPGTLTGILTQTFTAPANFSGFDKTKLSGKTFVGMPDAENPGTSETVLWVWAGSSLTGLTSYEWTYTTCCSEKWVTSNTNDDGINSPTDITGKPCPVVEVPPVVVTTPPATPTTPATVHTTAPPVVVATTSATVPVGQSTTTRTELAIVPLGNDGSTSLPVTGSSAPTIVAGVGTLMLLVGAVVLVMVLRKKRPEEEPVLMNNTRVDSDTQRFKFPFPPSTAGK